MVMAVKSTKKAVQSTIEDYIPFIEEVDNDDFDDDDVVHTPVEYVIEGVPIKFPFEAYQCQREMLERIIKTLNTKTGNALLESPTGSGKSMALLCGVLGWLENQKKLLRKQAEETYKERERCAQDYDKPLKSPVIDEDFEMPSNKKAKTESERAAVDGIICTMLPKIFITSRTHRQIAQLVKELGRTGYNPKFVVLGSRMHYCVNDAVRKEKDINEGCRQTAFNKEIGCNYLTGQQKKAKKELESHSCFTPNLDIEDLVKKGKKEKFCPYYSSRAALEHAEVIFAPYNYIVDPVVREAMDIDLNGSNSIVIMDEAHNIEDVSREAASFEVTDDALMAVSLELSGILKNMRKSGLVTARLVEAHESQGHVVAILMNWLRNTVSERGKVRRDFETSTTIWEGKSIVEELAAFGMGMEGIYSWVKDLEMIIDNANSKDNSNSINNKEKDDADDKVQILSFGSCQILKGIYYSMRNVLQDKNRFLNSFKMVKYQSTVFGVEGRKLVFTLGFWCLNPEVIFKPLADVTKSVILTSGTLSPMDTFTSELGTPFEQQLEAQHIIDEDQTWVQCVPIGPDGTTFLGNFKNLESMPFQDDLCRGIQRVTQTVPAGVLVFLPSYAFLDKLVKRMQMINVYDEISKSKKIFLEPRQGTPKDFEKLMRNYYEVIRECRGKSVKDVGLNGALLFAVYRGKISEGLDLKDDNCRVVITVGIPYPALKDPKVVVKREFNDRNGAGRALMTGQQWYECQAFRALNQAIGRCIRHRRDWGAVILMDQRFSQPRNVSQLSKWVRTRVRQTNGFENAMSTLSSFVAYNIAKAISSSNNTINTNVANTAHNSATNAIIID